MMYEDRLEAIQRMLAEATALRARSAQEPQAQMISGRYVAPSVFQNLANVAGSYMGRQKQAEAEALKAALMGQMQTDASQWMQQRPQATTEQLPGPVMPGMEQPSRTIAPTQQQNLEWAQKGMTNPLTRTLAAQYGSDTLIKEPEREEARAFRAEESEKQRGLQREANLQRLEAARERNQMMQQYYTGILTNQQTSQEQKAAAAEAMQELKRQELLIRQQAEENRLLIAQMTDATKRYGIDAKTQANRSKMSQKQLADLDEQDVLLQGIDLAVSKLGEKKSQESGVESFGRAAAGKLAGSIGLGENAVANIGRSDDVKNARQLAADISGGIKHGRYGAALSAGERGDAAQYLPTEWDSTEEISRKLNGLKTLMSLNSRRLKLMQDGGVTMEEAMRTYPPEVRQQSSDFPTIRNGAVTTPPGENEPTFTPSAAKALLKPGTKFKGTDGNYYVR